MHTENYLSATELSKKTAATLDSLEKSDSGEIIILKNNTPKAILLSIDTYSAMQEEIEDLRLAALGFARLSTFATNETISHQDMMKKFDL
ncbi:MAG: type II toxin-antitoxin system Phd/YefM family antitoxin [Thermodesulfobacteriota bacterium]|nr:type II toxin-antitoxin system Phd/YefM family antitoxin [Thermodesulfobacteriota bacterium]